MQEKKQLVAKLGEILEKHLSNEVEDIRSDTNNFKQRVELYYRKKIDFLSSIVQRAKQELPSELQTKKQEETKYNPQMICQGTKDLTKKEIDFVISQIRNIQEEKERIEKNNGR